MEKLPDNIKFAKLQVAVNPNGDIISLGKIIGHFNDLKDYLTTSMTVDEFVAECKRRGMTLDETLGFANKR